VGGSGQRELVEAIVGLRKIKKGRISVSGFDLTQSSQRKFVKRISYIPAERSETLAFSMSLEENLILKDYWHSKFSGRIFLNPRSINEHAKKIIAQYKIVAPSAKVRIASLSGGNIQRVILARELTRDFDLLIAVCPTAGLDVGLTKYVRQLLLEQRRKGKAILLLSEDLDELIELSDRIAILFEGKIIGTVDPSIGSEKIGMLMLGIRS
jgi:simple sugar transport system ATP-binding protein